MVKAETLHQIFSVPVGITICILGLIGNILSVLVWIRLLKKNKGGNKSTAVYLLTLAIADIGLLVFFMTTDSLPHNSPSVLHLYSFCAFHSYVGFPFYFFFVVFSIWLIVGVTINRSLMVLFPMKAKTLCSTARAYTSTLAIMVCCFIINVPHFFNYRPKEVNATYYIATTEYGQNGSSLKYEFWVHCMFLVLVPWAIIAFFNTCIIVALVKRAKHAGKDLNITKSNKRQSQDRQMTIMLLSITFSFLILLAWQCIAQCFFMLEFGKGYEQFEDVNRSFAAAKIGVVINSSTNFLLYCCTGSAFRRELWAVLGKTGNEVSSFTATTPITTKVSAESTVVESRD